MFVLSRTVIISLGEEGVGLCTGPLLCIQVFNIVYCSLYEINVVVFELVYYVKNIAIKTGRLWRRPVLGQSEIVCTVAILDVQGDTAISLCRELSLARGRALAFESGALGRAMRAHIVERTSGMRYSKP